MGKSGNVACRVPASSTSKLTKVEKHGVRCDSLVSGLRAQVSLQVQECKPKERWWIPNGVRVAQLIDFGVEEEVQETGN